MLNNKRINKSVALIGDFNKYQNKHVTKGFNIMDELDNRYQMIADAVKRIQGSK